MAETYKDFYSSTDTTGDFAIIPLPSTETSRDLGGMEEIHDLMITATSNSSSISSSWKAIIDVYIQESSNNYFLYNYLVLKDGESWHNEKSILLKATQSLMYKVRTLSSGKVNVSASCVQMKDEDIEYCTLTIKTNPTSATAVLTSGGIISTNKKITVPKGAAVTCTVTAPNYISKTTTYTVTTTKTETVTLTQLYTLKITTNATNATIVMTATGYQQQGDTIAVPSGTVVAWSVSAPHYISKSSSDSGQSPVTVTSNTTKAINLTLETHKFTITPTPSNATVTLTASGYSQSGNSITVPYNTKVSWSVSKEDYITKTGTYTVKSNYTMPVTLEESTVIPANTVIFESSGAGTYNVNITKNGIYQIWMVGGGAGGAQHYKYWHFVTGQTEIVYQGAGGGSGAYITGTIELTKGTYSVTVGAGGSGMYSSGTSTGGAGGNTTAFGQTAGGGSSHGWSTAGPGGTYTKNKGTLTGTNGKEGDYGFNGVAGGASLYGGYGKGGDTQKKSASNGGNGYIKITFKSTSS